MYFWDYGNAFLKEAGEAGADVWVDKAEGKYKYPSYVQDIMGPMCLIMVLVHSDGYVHQA